MIQINTSRLQLRYYTIADAPFIYELMNSEGWLNYIGDRDIKSIADAETYIEDKYLPSYELNRHGAYIVILRETGIAVGSCGLYKRENLKHPDIGFAFLTEYLGKGYGFEASQGVMQYARETLGIRTFLGITLPKNTPSIKLLKKLGLKKKGPFFFNEDTEELLLFSNE
ncbi:MAG: ribosomal-protein-alanine N-acetyltransferase [Ulvibacter sp.]|jgi:RimJ/RimL family protein N-acetyltransferase